MSQKSIETQDIYLAASLKVLGYRLDYIEKVGNKGIFFFDAVDDTVVTNFHLGNLRVEPVAFGAAVRALTTASRQIP